MRDYFAQSDFTAMQADALSHILAELATKEDLDRLEAKLTTRVIGAMVFLATVMTLLDAFID